MPKIDPEFARECARKYIENQIYAIQHDDPERLWDVVPEAWHATRNDDEAGDELWGLVCAELEDATITFSLKGETAADAERERRRADAVRLHGIVVEAQRKYDAACEALRAMDERKES